MRPFIAVLAAMLLLISCCSCSRIVNAAGTADRAETGASVNATASQPDEPRTLDAATAAAQQNLDRFSSGDFAAVWLLMARTLRDGITQTDFVAFYRTCKKIGQPIIATPVRLEGDYEAIVRMEVAGVARSRIMVYEDGHWLMEPTTEFAAHLGEPLEQIIAEEKAAGLCS
jgi:hypothetical protein